VIRWQWCTEAKIRRLASSNESTLKCKQSGAGLIVVRDERILSLEWNRYVLQAVRCFRWVLYLVSSAKLPRVFLHSSITSHSTIYLFSRVYSCCSKAAREWNGLIKSVLDGEADMIVTALQITPERNDIIDFSVPYLETGVSILVAVRDGVISPTAFLG